jgi:uncharacterized protein YybS (DUF2232 family)
MWLQRLTDYLLKNQWQTIGLVFLVTFLPLVGIGGILVAAFITLRRGVVAGAIMTVAATLPYLASFFISGHHEDATVPLVLWAAVGVAVLSNLMTWVFAVMLRRQMSWSNILQVAALVGVLVISVVHLIYPDVASWWGSQLHAYYLQTSQAINTVLNKAATPSDSQLETINITKQFATGVMVAGVLMNAILQLIVARWWEASIYSPGTLRKELHDIRLSRLAGALFMLSLVFSYLGNSVVLDIMPVLYLLFCAAGLSLIHYLFGLMASTTRWFWLSMLYIVLIFSLPVSLVMVSLLALLDIGLDIRKRLKKI